MVGAEEFDGVAEADAAGLHDPVDSGPTDVALAHAAPKIAGRGDDERGRAVVVERASSHQIGAGGLELDAEAFHQALDGDLFLESLDLVVRYARHFRNS